MDSADCKNPLAGVLSGYLHHNNCMLFSEVNHSSSSACVLYTNLALARGQHKRNIQRNQNVEQEKHMVHMVTYCIGGATITHVREHDHCATACRCR